MRVYIAGPITGRPNYRQDFDDAAAAVRREGHEPVNPATLGDPSDNSRRPWSWYMRRALRMLLDCDAILMLPGWESSRGASFEFYAAVTCGIPVTRLEDWTI